MLSLTDSKPIFATFELHFSFSNEPRKEDRYIWVMSLACRQRENQSRRGTGKHLPKGKRGHPTETYQQTIAREAQPRTQTQELMTNKWINGRQDNETTK